MSAAIPEGGYALAVQQEIRRAFQQGEALKALHLTPPSAPPPGARLGTLIVAAARSVDWRENVSIVKQAVDARLDRAEKLLREFASAIEDMRRIGDHLTDGDGLPEGLPSELALAARMLSGTEEGVQAGRAIANDQGAARRRHEALRGELVRARSAAAVAVAGWTEGYVRDLGLDPAALGVAAALREAKAAHAAVLTRYRAGQQEEAA